MRRCLLLMLSGYLSLIGLVHAVTVGELATFEAQSDGASSYEWVFPGQVTKSGAKVTYTFENSGQFPVTLKVTGTDGQENQVTKTVTVNHGDRPTAIIDVKAGDKNTTGRDIKIGTGDSITLNPDFTNQNQSALSSFWTINGKTYSQKTLTQKDFGKVGFYQVGLTVFDTKQQHRRDQASLRVVVENQPPEVSSMSVKMEKDGQVAKVSVTADDPDGTIESYRFEVLENGRNLLSQILDSPRASFNLQQFPGKRSYQFRVTVTDDRQASTRYDHRESVSLDNQIENNPPELKIVLAPGNEGQVGQWFNFLADASDPDRDALRYQWVFPGGQQYFSSQVRYKFSEGGEKTIVVRVSDGLETIEDSIVVKVNESPNNIPNVKIMSVLPGPSGDTDTLFKFNALGTDIDRDSLSYVWEMGDGGKVVSNTPSYRYAASGTYTAQVTVTDGRDESTDSVTVQVGEAAPTTENSGNNKAPVVTISALKAKETVNKPVRFTSDAQDPDLNSRLKYTWEMGDGVRYFTPQVSHPYRTPGPYEVKLTVSDGVDETVVTTLVDITTPDGTSIEASESESNISPQVRILSVAPQLSGEMDTIFRFYAQGQDQDGDALSYLWDMGDGQQMFIQNPAYRYSEAGAYTVKVTVNDGITTTSDSVLINVIDDSLHSSAEGSDEASEGSDENAETTQVNQPPQVSITAVAPATQGTTYTLFRFFIQANDSNGDDLSYVWDMGDGRSMTGQNPIYRYRLPGSYNAQVSVSDGNEVTTAEVAITVTEEDLVLNNPEDNQAPQTTVTAFPLEGTLDTVFRFEADSQDPDGDQVLYEWDMGDDAVYFSPNVQHQYREPGEYEIKLKTTDGLGSSLSNQTVVVKEVGLTPAIFTSEFVSPNSLAIIDQTKFGENSCELFGRRLQRDYSAIPLSLTAAQIALHEQLKALREQARGSEGDQLETQINNLQTQLKLLDKWVSRTQVGQKSLTSLVPQLSATEVEHLVEMQLNFEQPVSQIQAGLLRTLKTDLAAYRAASGERNRAQLKTKLNQTLQARNILNKHYDLQADVADLDAKQDYFARQQAKWTEDLDFTVDPVKEAEFKAKIIQAERNLDLVSTVRAKARIHFLDLAQAEAARCETKVTDLTQVATSQLVGTVADIEGTVDTTFFLYAKALTDYFENSLLFEWDLGDGRDSGGQNIYFKYPTPGLYEVTLKVSDELTSSRDQLRIRVYETWPSSDQEK